MHHSAVCVQPQIKHVWLTTHADCSILHQPTRSTCHLSVSLTQCWSLLSCETLRDTSATLMHITAEIRSTQHRWTAARPQDHHVSLTDQQHWDDRRQSSLLCDVFRRWTKIRENDDTVSSTLNIKENCVHWMKVQMKSERSFITSSSIWAQISWGEYRPQVSNNCFFRLMLKHHLNTPVTNQWSAHVSGLSLNLLCKSKEK